MNYSIDNMPIKLFDDVSRTQDFTLLNCKDAKKQWTKVYNEYIERFGLPKNFERYLELMSEALELYYDSMNGERYKYTLAQVKHKQANDLMKGQSADIHKRAAQLSKFMGFKVDVNTTTVSEFYNYSKLEQNG